MRRLAQALTALAALAFMVGPAAADIFSPGELSRAHADLEGLKNCTKCHVAGEQLSQERCLDCHTELRSRISAGKGFHGRMKPSERACEKCHLEHQGRSWALVDWGEKGKRAFDHSAIGWSLSGKHAGLDCARCHDPRLVVDATVRELLAKQPKRATHLGLADGCSSCHFDEHRGQTGSDCQRCHSEKGFKPPTHFDHAKTAFALEGEHAKVACDKCHPREADTTTPKGAFPAPRAADFLRFKPVAHASCTDCHQDPHQGRFGADCTSCHTPDGWKKVRNLEKERAFHEKTRFPLRGAHASARCEACHGRPARYRGLAFARCGDCHADAHLGQLASAGAGPDCERCHDQTSFKPPHFELEDHQKTGFALEGAHQAVACALCHPQEPKLAERVSPSVRRDLRRLRRPERFSFARLELDAAPERCEGCHEDPHRGQLARAGADDGGCTRCHQLSSFRELRFDHDRDSRFPLTGRHAGLECARCHRDEEIEGARAVRYKPLDTGCASCHPDVHLGQLASAGATDCARCHVTEGFEKTRFAHTAPFTQFELNGRHAALECKACHREVEVAQGVEAVRYKPLPQRCEGCHDDFHRGAFRGMEERFAGHAIPASSANADPQETRCAACHDEQSWTGASISHDQTGFPLRGAHARTGCAQCHPAGFEAPVSSRCATCHRDAHRGELGQQCTGCHDETSWTPRFTADAHRRGNFPLSGRHAVIPCQECHLETRDRGFSRAAVDCIGCHQADYQRTTVTSFDHQALGVSQSCRECHDTSRFSPARYAEHDRCFQISGGPHAGMRCQDCHTSLGSMAIAGTCNTRTAACSRCHACARTDPEHHEVPGYQCKDRKCYECHRFSTGD